METKKTSKPKFKPIYAVLIAIVAIAAVAFIAINYVFVPVVAAGDTINVTYTGAFTNGTVFNTNVGGQPLQFTVGAGQLIKGFDDGVIGMHINQQKMLTIPVNEAYGPVNLALIYHVPSNTFNQSIQVGSEIGMTGTGGVQERGIVTAVNNTTVTVNFNPPLAGQTLVFTVKVLSIKKGQ